MPGGPRGLQNRRCHASGEVGSIPILSASFLQAPRCVEAFCVRDEYTATQRRGYNNFSKGGDGRCRVSKSES